MGRRQGRVLSSQGQMHQESGLNTETTTTTPQHHKILIWRPLGTSDCDPSDSNILDIQEALYY